MVTTNIKCPFCGSENIGKFGYANGKQRYECKNEECTHRTFIIDYTYNACKPDIESKIVKLSVEGMGIRSIARTLKISKDTVLSVLKKKKNCSIM